MASLDIFTFGAASYLFLIVEPKLAKRAITPGIERERIDESLHRHSAVYLDLYLLSRTILAADILSSGSH